MTISNVLNTSNYLVLATTPEITYPFSPHFVDKEFKVILQKPEASKL